MSDSTVERVREFDDAVLSAQGVESGYGDFQVLYGADLDVRSDEIVLVFGPNGAGKSTLLKTLYGLLPLWEGGVELHGQDISGVQAEDMTTEGICYVPQVENVFPNLTVDENLDIGGIHVEDSEAARESVFDLFPRLADRRDQDAETLSGGERQMLAVARGWMGEGPWWTRSRCLPALACGRLS